DLRQDAGQAVRGAARAGREALADLLLDHRHPQMRTGQLLDGLEDRARRDAVGQVGDDLGRRRVECAQVQAHGVGEVQRRVGERVESVAQGGLERTVDLYDMDMRGTRSEVLGEHAEAAADLEHHVLRAELGGALDDAEDVGVDEEVLAELAVGPDPELAQAAQAGLHGVVAAMGHPAPPYDGDVFRPVDAGHPKTCAAVCSTSRSSSSRAMPRRSATKRAVCATNAGWLRSLRTACGVRYGASVSTSRRSAGTRAAAS